MRNKYLLITAAGVLLLAFIVGLCGLPFASAEDQQASGGDRLIGVFVTREHLDLFDAEGYFQYHAGTVMSGGEIDPWESEKFEGRLYAALKNETYKTDDGQTYESTNYVFEGVEGYPFFCAIVTDESGNTYTTASGDGAISGNGTHLSHTDEGTGIELSGTLYSLPTGNIVWYTNPVYQSPDGSVYLVSGQGLSVSNETGDSSEGESMTHTLSEDTRINIDGEIKTWSAKIELSMSIMFRPVRVAVLHMGRDGELLQRDEYEPGALPDAIAPAEGAEYIIAETVKEAPDGSETATRELFNSADEALKTFAAKGNICVQHYTTLDW